MLPTFFVMLVIFQCIKSVTNILNRSPTSQTCRPLIWSATSVTNINVTYVTYRAKMGVGQIFTHENMQLFEFGERSNVRSRKHNLVTKMETSERNSLCRTVQYISNERGSSSNLGNPVIECTNFAQFRNYTLFFL